jgi:hypothetical protein
MKAIGMQRMCRTSHLNYEILVSKTSILEELLKLLWQHVMAAGCHVFAAIHPLNARPLTSLGRENMFVPPHAIRASGARHSD